MRYLWIYSHLVSHGGAEGGRAGPGYIAININRFISAGVWSVQIVNEVMVAKEAQEREQDDKTTLDKVCALGECVLSVWDTGADSRAQLNEQCSTCMCCK